MDNSPSQSLLSRLPIELRLEIYNLLLVHSPGAVPPNHVKPTHTPIPAGYQDYQHERKSSPRTLRIRAEDPGSYEMRAPKHVRSTFMIRSRMRGRCMATTYFSLDSDGIYTSLLLANAQIHAEAAEVLYSNHTFDFDTHIEALVAFVNDLTPTSRNYVRSIRIVKRALPYEKEFDRAEWAIAMQCLAQLGQLKRLSLGVVAGKPAQDGWNMVTPFKPDHFDMVRYMDGMEWIDALLKIKGLDKLEVDAVVEHCQLPRSVAMARYIQFSASVEGSFAEYLTRHMVGEA